MGPDETPQNVASHQGLHCLPHIQQFSDINMVGSYGVIILRVNRVTSFFFFFQFSILLVKMFLNA